MEIKRLYKNGWSKLALVAIAVTWIWVYFNNKLWKEDHVVYDTIYYYEYLPAFYIYHDLSLQFTDTVDGYVKSKIWYNTTPSGKKVNKTTMGLAYLYAPFFFAGYVLSALLHEPQTGYSSIYYGALNTGCLFYLIIGLFFLMMSLFFYFSDEITACVLICVFLGTNLFYYSLFANLMPHTYLFALLSIFIYCTIQWNRNPTWIITLFSGLLLGTMSLIRPPLILAGSLFLLYGIFDKASLVTRIQFLKSAKMKLLATCLMMMLPWIPQVIYWKIASGEWLYYPYPGEKFYFTNPHIIDGLFSYRKGWLLYTPIMTMALIGFWFMKKSVKELLWGSLILFTTSAYIIFSWWCWWYGGSYGQRPMIDYYGLLAFPMGAFFEKISKKKAGQITLTIICVLLIELSLLQTWQMKRGMIHYDANTKESYWLHFGKTCGLSVWWEKVKTPDYEKALRGEDEY